MTLPPAPDGIRPGGQPSWVGVAVLVLTVLNLVAREFNWFGDVVAQVCQ